MLDPEVGQRAPEKNRRQLARQESPAIERYAGRRQQLDFIHRIFHELAARFRQGGGQRRQFNGPGRNPAVRIPLVEQMSRSRADVNDAGKVAPRAQGPIHGHRVDLEFVFDLRERLQRTAPRTVHLVDERDHRDSPQCADPEQLFGLGFHPFRQVDDHDGAIGGHQRAVGVLAEIMVSRGVEQIDLMPFELERQHGRTDGDSPLLFELHPVRRRGALGLAAANRSGHVDTATEEQQLFRERRLARIRVRDDGKRSPSRDFAFNSRIDFRHSRVHRR